MEALENLDLIFLCLDEMVDQGYAYDSILQFLLLIASLKQGWVKIKEISSNYENLLLHDG